nr:uncharacterized protein LOC118971938 isoform X2 [Manis javanica]
MFEVWAGRGLPTQSNLCQRSYPPSLRTHPGTEWNCCGESPSLVQLFLARLQPCRMYSVGFVVGLFSLVSWGPIWEVPKFHLDTCQQAWWMNSLLVNNFPSVQNVVNPSWSAAPGQCSSCTGYLANDFHIYLTTSAIVFIHGTISTELELALWMKIPGSLHHCGDKGMVSHPFLMKSHGNLKQWNGIAKGIFQGGLGPTVLHPCLTFPLYLCRSSWSQPTLPVLGRYNWAVPCSEPVFLNLLSGPRTCCIL